MKKEVKVGLTVASLALIPLVTPVESGSMEPSPRREPIVRYVTEYVTVSHPADQCQEDGAWVAVNWKSGDAIEDSHGVSRACRNIDDMIDMAFEVAIQEGIIQYVP